MRKPRKSNPWLLLVPRIALYYTNDGGEPYGVDVKYAWGRAPGPGDNPAE